MLLAKSNSNQDGVRKHTLDNPVSLGKISMRFVMTGLFAALALLYLTQSTQGAARSYQLRALEEERKNLTYDQQGLELEAVRLRSLPVIETVTQPTSPTDTQANWVPIGKVAQVAVPSPLATR